MGQAVEPKKVIYFQDEKGTEPFTVWLHALRDGVGRRKILDRINRLEQGNYGDCKPVGGGVSELRIDFGPAYRVYFIEPEKNLVVILCGGIKNEQPRDIKTAKFYQKEYKDNETEI